MGQRVMYSTDRGKPLSAEEPWSKCSCLLGGKWTWEANGLGRLKLEKREGLTEESYRVEKVLQWGPSKEASKWRYLLLSPCLLLPLENDSGLVVVREASPMLPAKQRLETTHGWAWKVTHRILAWSQTLQKELCCQSENFGFGTGKTFQALK